MVMTGWLETYKPTAALRWHLFLAALMWSIVGVLLLVFGARWVLGADVLHPVLLVVFGIGAGVVKAWLVLDRAAGRIVSRIRTRGDGRCLGGFLSVRTWLLVMVMAVGGRLLRTGLLPTVLVGLIYVAVGTGLAPAARNLWRAWYHQRSPSGPTGS